jgi:hypothetical protein
VAAMLCRRWTTATLRELSGRFGFGLSHPDSASDLIRRGKRLAESHRDVATNVASIEMALGLTLPSPPLFRNAGVGERMIEFAAGPTAATDRPIEQSRPGVTALPAIRRLGVLRERVLRSRADADRRPE